MDKTKIMIVEDEGIVAADIARQLRDLGYDVVATAYSGEEAIEKVREARPDLVLMDIVLQGKMDGVEVAGQILASFDIPVVYLTAYADDKILARAKITGPFGYIVKPFETKDLHAAVEMALYKHGMENALRESHARLERNLKGTIDVISKTIELKGPYAPEHHQRVSRIASAIATEMGLSDFQVKGIELAAAVYDIGLTSVPIEFLQDTEQLEGIKLTMYQGYPQMGYDMLKKIEFPWPIADIILQHRKCFDGSGFPRGIKGEDILVEARILAVADALGNLTCHRSFRNALPIEAALEEISKHKGTSFDPEVVDACLRLFRDRGYKMEG